MLFNSFTFLFIFLPIFLILYFLFKNIKIKNIILCIFSLIFYAWGEPKYIILMLLSILINYIFALLIDKYKNISKKLLIIDIIINILVLFIFKYINFFIFNFSNIFNLDIKLLNIVLPIGISFYTFQMLSYVIDVYLGKVKVQRNVITLTTYIACFPQLIAGPIVRYKTVEKQLNDRTINFNKFMNGLERFIIGLGKKVILSNNVAMVADLVFSNVYDFGTISIWVGAIAYTFQIYFDFSGYSNMAIGLGKMLGFDYNENFNYPYISKSITEFWRRWHMTLSVWFRDYVYIPLGGNRVNKIKWIRNILIVWLLTGLWHGASWNFVIWGLYYGILLIFEKLYFNKVLEKIPNFLCHVYSLIIIVVGWVIFRCEDMSMLLHSIKTMFIFKQSNLLEFILENYEVMLFIPISIVCIFASIPTYKYIKKILNKYKYSYLLKYSYLYVIYIICLISLLASTYNPFIYFKF